nr:sigma-70 family RNA polymerase sigma factor [Pontibacillus sp. HN14]
MKELPAEEIIEVVFNDYGGNIKSVIYTYVKSGAQTEDIFQEFLISVYKNSHLFKGESSFKTWLYRIAINKCKDYLKSPIHRIFTTYNDQLSNKSTEASPEQRVVEKELEGEIVKAIMSLPIKYREVFVLRYYQSFSIRQISESIGIKESTVKSRIMRGKKKLQSKLGGDYFEEN